MQKRLKAKSLVLSQMRCRDAFLSHSGGGMLAAVGFGPLANFSPRKPAISFPTGVHLACIKVTLEEAEGFPSESCCGNGACFSSKGQRRPSDLL